MGDDITDGSYIRVELRNKKGPLTLLVYYELPNS